MGAPAHFFSAPFTDYIGADHILWSSNLPLAIRLGRAPAKPSIIVPSDYRQKPANECCGETRRSFIGYRVSELARYFGRDQVKVSLMLSRFAARTASAGID